MPRHKKRKHAKPRIAWRIVAWGVTGVCLAAAVWLVVRSEQRWTAARRARERFLPALGQSAKSARVNDTSHSNEDDLAGQVLRNTGPRDGGAGQPSDAPPAGQERSGHHRLGPAGAAVQIALLFDYGCQQCQQIEQDVRALMKRFPGRVSFLLWHYPQSTDCNHSLKLNTHPTACQAARAAETAGILQGEDGFWKMHAWLFQRLGHISDQELRHALPSLGYGDVDHFLEVMNGPVPLEHVLQDVLDAATLVNARLGTIVMNGIQLDGDEVGDAMAQAVRFLEGKLPGDALVTATGGTSAGRPFPTEILLAASGATVQVVNVSTGDKGSGVLVGQQGSVVYLLTADHLLPRVHLSADDPISADRGDRLEIRCLSTDGTAPLVYRSIRVVARAPDDDLAVLRFSTRRDVPALLRICPPEQIPADENFAAASIGWSGNAPTNVLGKVTSKKRVRKRTRGAATLVWEFNKPSKPGQSGGPLVDPNGYVVGVASGNSRGHGYFCHTELIHRLLGQNGLEWLYSEKTPTLDKTSPEK